MQHVVKPICRCIQGFVLCWMTMGAALAEAQPFAYVANGNGNSVSVIDTDPASATFNTVIGTPIPVGNDPAGVAITPNGKRAYITNQNSDTVSVIDTDPASATFDTVVAIIPVGFSPSSPIGVAITPDGKRAYVTLGSDNAVK